MESNKDGTAKPFDAATGSANWRDACATARKERLNQGLRTLASWAQSRAMGEHDDEATLTMLERKTAELRASVNKAGWDSVAESYSPNDPSSPATVGAERKHEQ